MRHRGVRDVMTKDVVAVESDTPYKQIAEILAEHKISGVPVVDSDAHVLGGVSEADLLAKAEYPEAECGGVCWIALVRRRHVGGRALVSRGT